MLLLGKDFQTKVCETLCNIFTLQTCPRLSCVRYILKIDLNLCYYFADFNFDFFFFTENKAQSILEYLGQFGLKPSGLTHQNMEEIRNHLQNLNQPNYYMPMIIASVIGGVILLVLIIVGGLYLKRTTTYKAIISGGDRRNQKASFTNRAFKVCSYWYLAKIYFVSG